MLESISDELPGELRLALARDLQRIPLRATNPRQARYRSHAHTQRPLYPALKGGAMAVLVALALAAATSPIVEVWAARAVGAIREVLLPSHSSNITHPSLVVVNLQPPDARPSPFIDGRSPSEPGATRGSTKSPTATPGAGPGDASHGDGGAQDQHPGDQDQQGAAPDQQPSELGQPDATGLERAAQTPAGDHGLPHLTLLSVYKSPQRSIQAGVTANAGVSNPVAKRP